LPNKRDDLDLKFFKRDFTCVRALPQVKCKAEEMDGDALGVRAN
jgi:hypothetical protein